MDNDILYLNVRGRRYNGGNGQFYLFNKLNETINISNINSRNLHFHFSLKQVSP